MSTTAPTSAAASTTGPQPAAEATDEEAGLPAAREAIATGSIGISATRSSSPPSMEAGSPASLKRQTNDRIHEVEKTVRWKGKNYVLSVDISLLNPVTDKAAKTQLQGSSEQLIDLFWADLENTLNTSELKPGQDIAILFTPEGYIAFTPPPGLDVPNTPAEEIRKIEGAKESTTAQSAALASLVTEATPKKLVEGIQKPELEPLRKLVQKHRRDTETTNQPVNLVNRGASCFVNAPFMQLVNDPVLAEHLDNPENYKNKENNPLYRAVQAYRRAQAAGSTQKLDIVKILKIVDTFQMDAYSDAWEIFKGHLAKNLPIDSPLQQVFNTHSLQLNGDGETSLNALASTAFADATELPSILSLHIPRVEINHRDLSDQLSQDEKLNFLSELKKIGSNINSESLREAFGEDITNSDLFQNPDYEMYIDLRNSIDMKETDREKNNELKRTLEKYYYLSQIIRNVPDLGEFITQQEIVTDEDIEIANQILNDECLFSALTLLPKEIRNTINSKRSLKKNQAKLDIDKSGRVTLTGSGITKEYDIVSVNCHSGANIANGHYIPYVRKGATCWKVNDLESAAIGIDLKEFIEKARSSSLLILHEVGRESVTAASSDKNESQTHEEQSPAIKEEQIEGTLCWMSESEGNLPKEGYTWVNQTKSGAKTLHPQIRESLGAEEKERKSRSQVILTDVIRAGLTPWYRKNRKFEPRSTLLGLSTRPDIHLTTTPISPIPPETRSSTLSLMHLPTEPLTTDAAVKQATFDALEFARDNKITSIALPVFECSQELRAVEIMNAAIREFAQKNKNSFKDVHIRIVRPKKAEETAPPLPTIPTPAKPVTPALPQDTFLFGNGCSLKVIEAASGTPLVRADSETWDNRIIAGKSEIILNFNENGNPETNALTGTIPCFTRLRDDSDAIKTEELEEILKGLPPETSVTVIINQNSDDKNKIQTVINNLPPPLPPSPEEADGE